MDNLLKAVKSVKHNGSTPSAQLTAVESRASVKPPTADRDDHRQDLPTSSEPIFEKLSPIQSPGCAQDVLYILRSGPSTDQLTAALDTLVIPGSLEDGFQIGTPGPLQAQIFDVLVSITIPNFWPTLDHNARQLLARCLLNVTAVSAIVAKIQALTSQIKAKMHPESILSLRQLLSVLSNLLRPDDSVCEVWVTLHGADTFVVKAELAWKQFANLVGSGKVLSVVVEAEDSLLYEGTRPPPSWLSNGLEYAAWLGRNAAYFTLQKSVLIDADWQLALGQLITRTLTLGQEVPFVSALFTRILRLALHEVSRTPSSVFAPLMTALPLHAKKRLFEQTLRWLSTLVTSETDYNANVLRDLQDSQAIASLIEALAGHDDHVAQHLVTLLRDPVASSSYPFIVRRAILAATAPTSMDKLQDCFEGALRDYGDPLFVRHAPIIQQESMAQTILLMAGCIHRRTPMAILLSVRSSGHMQGISNRLETSNTRARWLGMVLSTALSGITDKAGSKMDFGTDDMQTAEAKWYVGLVDIDDKIGTHAALLNLIERKAKSGKKRRGRIDDVVKLPIIDGKPTFGPLRPPTQSYQTEVEGARVTELVDASSDSDSDLKPYAKPDSDPEDSDEDATLVNRNKTRPPVYIRELMTMLRDIENHGPFTLGLQHAAGLIRRKIGFGREISDHAEELARIICNLQDPFDTDDFDELRLQALIAVVMSDVERIAPWLSRQTFVGEYSLAQRCIMLTALGLSGRELAGLKEEDVLSPVSTKNSFPSKQLPSHLHEMYSPGTRRLQAAHTLLEKSLIAPLALRAADQSTAHLNAVKVRTFSSRMETLRTKRKTPPNALAKIFAQNYFAPLVRSYQQNIAAYGNGSVWSSAPFLLVTFLKTLALLLHASGPATSTLREVTEEFWQLLLSLRVQALSDITILEAVLFGFLTLLEVDTNKHQIADEHPKLLVETREWVDMIFDRTGGGGLVDEEGTGEEAKVRTLAAGVLVRAGEIMETSRATFMGGMSDF